MESISQWLCSSYLLYTCLSFIPPIFAFLFIKFYSKIGFHCEKNIKFSNMLFIHFADSLKKTVKYTYLIGLSYNTLYPGFEKEFKMDAGRAGGERGTEVEAGLLL